MIGWIIFCLLVALLILLLFSRIRVHIDVAKDGKLDVSCKYLFFELFKFYEEKDESQEPADKAKKTAKKSKFQLKRYIKTYDDVIELLHTVKNILVKFKMLIKKVVIKNTEMELVVVGSDAAATALMYGAVCSAVYPILNLLSNCFTFKPDKINVAAGFSEKEMKFSLSSDFSVRSIYLLKFAISAVFEIFKLKKELD